MMTLCGARDPVRDAVCVIEVRPVNRHEGVPHCYIATVDVLATVEPCEWIVPPPSA